MEHGKSHRLNPCLDQLDGRRRDGNWALSSRRAMEFPLPELGELVLIRSVPSAAMTGTYQIASVAPDAIRSRIRGMRSTTSRPIASPSRSHLVRLFLTRTATRRHRA